MITNMQEYYDKLFEIQSQNPPVIADLPYAKTIYEIDAHSREVNSPKFLSVLKDHKSENIYFKIDRFVDYMDLSTTTCIIQYKTKKGTGIYPVPFYDIRTLAEEDKMIIPWCIDGYATAASGKVEYAFKFYKIDRDGKVMLYTLNTIPTTGEVLYGMDVQSEDFEGQYNIPPTVYEQVLAMVDAQNKKDVFWIELK